MAQSTSADPSDVRLSVYAGSPLAEVFLMDHAFAMIRRSVGDLQTRVEPGVYKVKARLGDAEAERLLLCDHDLDVDLSQDLVLSSPAPLAGAAGGAEAPEAAVSRALVNRSPAPPNAGAQVMLMTRSPDRDTKPPDVSLHDETGDPIPFTVSTASATARGGLATLRPGPYYLRWRAASGAHVEQSIPAIAGWQTQVFVLQEPGPETDLGLTRVSVQLNREGFDADSEDLRRSEELRTALADERKVAAHGLDDLLERSDSPMLGLFGAHLMLLARDAGRRRTSPTRLAAPVHFDEAMFERLVHRLGELLGTTNPDVVALRTQVHNPRLKSLPPVATQPMLWRSWLLLIEASNDAPELVRPGLWRRAVATVPLRPFLMWARDAGETAARVEQVLTTASEATRDHDRDWRRALTNSLLVPRAVVDTQAPHR